LKKIETSRSEQLLQKLCMLNEEMIIEIGDVNTLEDKLITYMYCM